MAEPHRRSTLTLAILSLLAERPMHPYRMQQLIRQRGKDKVVNVGQRASLYKAIERLAAGGLVAVRETSRDQRFPERTVYEITELGREVLTEWIRDGLAKPERAFLEFPAILSFMVLLSPTDVRRQLEERLARLEADAADLEAGLASAPVPRVFLVEDEYRLAQRRAEMAWVGSLLDDLRTRRLTWTEAWVRKVANAAEGRYRPQGLRR